MAGSFSRGRERSSDSNEEQYIMRIRKLKNEESVILKDFTYEAIFIPEG